MTSFISVALVATLLLGQLESRPSRTEGSLCALSFTNHLEEPSENAAALIEIALAAGQFKKAIQVTAAVVEPEQRVVALVGSESGR